MYTLPTTVFGLLTLIILTLSGVVAWQNRRIEALYKEREEAQEARRIDTMTIGQKALETMQGFSQTVQLIESKLLASKSRGRR